MEESLYKELQARERPILPLNHDLLVSIIIVNRNGIDYLKTLIPALLQHTVGINYELILVDNMSTDDSVKYFENEVINFTPAPGFKIIKNSVNKSFSTANNQAVKCASGQYIVLLNNDIKPLSNWLDYLLRDAQKIHNLGSMGVRLIYPEYSGGRIKSLWGKAKKEKEVSGKIQHAGIAYKNEYKLFRPYNLGKTKLFNHPDVIKSTNKSALTAACLLVPKVVYEEVGGLDESFNYGGEDVDFGLKLLKAGYVNYYCADSVLFHYEFGTQSKEQKKQAVLRRQKNQLLLQNKWFLFLKKKFWLEKIVTGESVFSEFPLTVAVLKKQQVKLKKTIEQFESYGCKVSFFSSRRQLLKYRYDSDLFLEWNTKKEVVVSNKYFVLKAEGKWFKTLKEQLIRCYLNPSIVIKIPVSKPKRAQNWGDYHMAVMLKHQLEQEGCRVIIQIFPEWNNDDGMECDIAIVFRGLKRYEVKPHQINIMWNISHPDDVSIEEYEEYDKVFIASELWANQIAKKVAVPVETMLQCTDPSRFFEPSEAEKKKYYQQLLFVGNSRGVYRRILKDLLPTNRDLAVYGKNWKKIIPDKYIKSSYINNDQLYKYYGSAGILLNDHWDDMREKGFVSNRVFDGLASGAFIISDKVKNMGELEKYIAVYDTRQELKECINYYFKHPVECRKKYYGGAEYIRKNHTFEDRAKQFLKSIHCLIKERTGFSVRNLSKTK